MKRIISIILLSALLCTMMAVCVSSAVYAIRTCPECNTKTMTALCGEYVSTNYGGVSCAYAEHGDNCWIIRREYYTAYGKCSNATCIYYTYETERYEYPLHVHIAHHTSTKEDYNVCTY